MKFYSIAFALALLLSPVQTLAKPSTGDSDYTQEATHGALPDEESPSATKRYIVKYKKGSSDYNARLKNAKDNAKRGQGNGNGGQGRGNSGQQGNRGKTRNSPAVQERGNGLLRFGSFLPRENAEVVFLDSDNEKRYKQRDDVEYVELGEGDILHCMLVFLKESVKFSSYSHT